MTFFCNEQKKVNFYTRIRVNPSSTRQLEGNRLKVICVVQLINFFYSLETVAYIDFPKGGGQDLEIYFWFRSAPDTLPTPEPHIKYSVYWDKIKLYCAFLNNQIFFLFNRVRNFVAECESTHKFSWNISSLRIEVASILYFQIL